MRIKRIYTKQDKERAKSLLVSGASYRQIFGELKVPKSTLSSWFNANRVRKTPESRNQMLERLTVARKSASIAIRKKFDGLREREDTNAFSIAQSELRNLHLEDKAMHKAMLAMLYWAEGAKYEGVSGLKFVNTDSSLMHLFLILLRRAFHIDEEKLRITLHLHYYHPIKDTKDYWSKLLDVPIEQFNKIYIKQRNSGRRFRKNFMGICMLYYGSTPIRKELMMLATLIQKFIISK